MSDERNTDTFQVVRFDEGGEKIGRDGNHRLVCNIEGGGKTAIWGSKDNRHNIETVLKAGIPCTVECEYHEPGPWGNNKFNHTHWVQENFRLRVL